MEFRSLGFMEFRGRDSGLGAFELVGVSVFRCKDLNSTSPKP